MGYGQNYPFRFLRGMFDIFVYSGVPPPQARSQTTKPGANSKVSPGRTEEAPTEKKNTGNPTRKSPNESPSGYPAASPQKRDAFHDEHPDDAPHHEPYAQPAPHSHASYADDAPNQL